MRLAALALLILTTPAAAGGPVRHTTAEYLAAYVKARAYALAHSPLLPQPSCRKAIGDRAGSIVEQRCRDVAASTRTNCTNSDICETVLDRLAWHCGSWRGDVACVYPQEGGAYIDPALRGEWRPRP